LRELCIDQEIGVITYFSLAKGFLSGKYRSEADLGQSPRGGGVKAYLNERGRRILSALDDVSKRLSAKPAEVALAWIMVALCFVVCGLLLRRRVRAYEIVR